MRNKSNPVLLVSALVVLAMVLSVGGMTGFFINPGRFFAPEPPKPPTPPPKTQESTKDSKAKMTSALSQARMSRMRPDGEDGLEMINGVPAQPTLLIPEIKINKPQVNDSNISAQWYREESRQKARAEQKEKERRAAAGQG